MMLSSEKRSQLCHKATEVAQLAYAPYSKFRVGAAILGQNKIYTGTNIENASYGLTLCAERAAFADAIASGEREFQAIAIACIDAATNAQPSKLMPCGACRQWIAELAPNAEIIIVGIDQSFSLSDLLPQAFTLHS
ncbi:MAG: cytidine deaminase [Microcystaceae cyanobacterium]